MSDYAILLRAHDALRAELAELKAELARLKAKVEPKAAKPQMPKADA